MLGVNFDLQLPGREWEGERESVQRDLLQIFTQRDGSRAKGGLLAEWRTPLELWSATGLAYPSETQHRHRDFGAGRTLHAALARRRHQLRGHLSR